MLLYILCSNSYIHSWHVYPFAIMEYIEYIFIIHSFHFSSYFTTKMWSAVEVSFKNIICHFGYKCFAAKYEEKKKYSPNEARGLTIIKIKSFKEDKLIFLIYSTLWEMVFWHPRLSFSSARGFCRLNMHAGGKHEVGHSL